MLVVEPFLGIYAEGKPRLWVAEPEFAVYSSQVGKAYAKDGQYLPGGFSIRWYGEERFGERYCDDVLWLASLLEQAVTDYQKAGRASMLFPDQPVELRLDRGPRPGEVQVRLDGKTILLCPEEAFSGEVLGAIGRLRSFLAGL